MKIKRQKQARHVVSVYKNLLGFKEPFKMLIDGTFCHAALKLKNIHIRDHLKKYLNSEIECFTTQCVLHELGALGQEMFGAKMIAQRFKIHHCGHKKKPLVASECLKSVINNEPNTFFLASQDKVGVSKEQQETIKSLKTVANILPNETKKRRKRKAKGPNPLSCKPKKKNKTK